MKKMYKTKPVRLVLIKTTLENFRVYMLSLFVALGIVLREIKRIVRNFLLGITDKKKVSLLGMRKLVTRNNGLIF